MLEALLLIAASGASPSFATEGPVSVPDRINARSVTAAIRMARKYDDKTICTRVMQGASRVKAKKVCMTSQEWRDVALEKDQLMRDLTGGISCKGNSG